MARRSDHSREELKELALKSAEELLKEKYVDKADFEHIFIANNCSEAFEIIEAVYLDYLAGKEIHCKNYKKFGVKV